MSRERLEPLVGTKQDGESNKAVQALNDFLRLGPGRTLVGLWKKYREIRESTTPTRSRDTIERWSVKFSWFDRAAIYDRRLEEEKNARARAIMESGLALDYERVSELKTMADFLKEQIYARSLQKSQDAEESQEEQQGGINHPYVWVRDVKQIGAGESAKQVEIFRFNAAILDLYRATLDDIAKETGGRVTKNEVTGPNGGPIAVNDEQHDRAVSTLADALRTILSGGSAGGENDLGPTE